MEKCVVVSKVLWNIQLFHSYNQEDILEFGIAHFKTQFERKEESFILWWLRSSAFYELAGP